MRRGSPRQPAGRPGAQSTASSRPCAPPPRALRSTAWSTTSAMTISTGSIRSFPASILEKSRISLTTANRRFARSHDLSKASRALSRSSQRRQPILAKPRTPFIRVRISWLMLARNSLRTPRFSAAVRGLFRALAAAHRSLMSTKPMTAPLTAPGARWDGPHTSPEWPARRRANDPRR